MRKIHLANAAGGISNKRQYLFGAIIGIALLLLVGGFIQRSGHVLAGSPETILQTSTPTSETATTSVGAKPLYFKKSLVFKRTLAESEYPSIRTSELTDGYKAISNIPPYVMAPQGSVRMPQFPDSSALGNYQALSTLGTQQYYSNLNVQQYLNNLSNQQWLNSLNNTQRLNQQVINNLNTQTYLNNMTNWQNTTVLNAQQYLNTLNTQQYMNNMNNQQYLNNWNTFSNPTFSQPTFSQPMPSIPRMPSIPVMPSIPSFNFP
jgi:hypothetical protein